MAHAGAIEAWEEVKAATNDMQIIKSSQGDLVWSASGHGFGGMIMQVAALDLKARGLLFSAQSFGSAPVFNTNAARRWDDLFIRWVHSLFRRSPLLIRDKHAQQILSFTVMQVREQSQTTTPYLLKSHIKENTCQMEQFQIHLMHL